MNTYIPYRDFTLTAQCLSREHLFKQRCDAKDILVILLGRPDWCSEKQYKYLMKRYQNSPTVLQWKECELALLAYQKAICTEWTNRGYVDNCWLQSVKTCEKLLEVEKQNVEDLKVVMPWWLSGGVRYHKASLLYKNIRHYKQFKWVEKPVRIFSYYPVTKDSLEYHLENQRAAKNAPVKKAFKFPEPYFKSRMPRGIVQEPTPDILELISEPGPPPLQPPSTGYPIYSSYIYSDVPATSVNSEPVINSDGGVPRLARQMQGGFISSQSVTVRSLPVSYVERGLVDTSTVVPPPNEIPPEAERDNNRWDDDRYYDEVEF